MSKHRESAGKRRRYRSLISKFRENHGALTDADRDLLQQWEESEDAIATLIKIVGKIEPAKEEEQIEAAAVIIHSVLIARADAIADDDFSREVSAKKREERRLKKVVKSKLAKAIKDASQEQLAAGVHHLTRAMEKLAKAKDISDLELSIRSDRNGSRRRTLFMQSISDTVHKLTNLRLDDEVAALTEIAFPGKELSGDAVRSATRPSTRSGRKMSGRRR